MKRRYRLVQMSAGDMFRFRGNCWFTAPYDGVYAVQEIERRVD